MKKSFADRCLDRAEKATPGPWGYKSDDNQINSPTRAVGLLNGLENREFIAAAREMVPELCRRLKRACQVLRRAGHSFIDIEGKEMEAQICRLVADELEKMPEDEK